MSLATPGWGHRCPRVSAGYRILVGVNTALRVAAVHSFALLCQGDLHQC